MFALLLEENSKFLTSEGETLRCTLVSALYTLNVVPKVEYAYFEDRYDSFPDKADC